MKPFRFSLESVRMLREQKEQKAQQAFGHALRLHDEAAFQLQSASEELLSAWNALCHEMSGGAPASRLTRTRAWCNVLELRQKERAEALQRARRAMDAALKEMLAATRDREAIDQYRDKCQSRHEQAAHRDEQKTLDELGLRRARSWSAGNSRHL